MGVAPAARRVGHRGAVPGRAAVPGVCPVLGEHWVHGAGPPGTGGLLGGVSRPPGQAGVGCAAASHGTALSPWGPVSGAAWPGGLPAVRGYYRGSCVTD